MTTAIAIICKTPRPGVSKTRMIPLLGADMAARLAGAFLRDIAGIIQEVSRFIVCRGFAVYAPEGSEDVLRTYLPPDFKFICQQDVTLGAVLLRTTELLLLQNYAQVVLVNADSPTLPPCQLIAAVEALRRPEDRMVVGPAVDGGYYLIGLKRAHARLFSDIPWSTADVLARTRERAREISLPVFDLQTWYDVDDAEGLNLLKAELAGERPAFAQPSAIAPIARATRALLAGSTP